MQVIWPQTKSLFMHRTVSTVIKFLNGYMYILFVVISPLLADLYLVVICLFVCSRRFIGARYYYNVLLLIR